MDRGNEQLEQLLQLAGLLPNRGNGSQAEAPSGSDSDLLAICAGAFAMGLVRGRWGKVEPFGVPLDLGLGALLELLARSGALGSQTRVAQALATSSLSAYFTTWGATIGTRLKLGLPVSGQPSTEAKGTLDSAQVHGAGAPPNDSQVLESIRSIIAN